MKIAEISDNWTTAAVPYFAIASKSITWFVLVFDVDEELAFRAEEEEEEDVTILFW